MNKVIEKHPNDYTSYEFKGRCYYFLNNYKDALKNLDKAIELEPNDPDPFDYRGRTEYNLGNYKNAIKEFDIAEKLSNNDPILLKSYFLDIKKDKTYLRLRGLSYKALGNKERAKKDLEKAFSLSDKESEGLLKSLRTSHFLKSLINKIFKI